MEVEAQIEDIPIGVTMPMPVPVVNEEGEVSKSNNAPKKGVMLNMLNHKISILKKISQDTHNAFTNLQATK